MARVACSVRIEKHPHLMLIVTIDSPMLVHPAALTILTLPAEPEAVPPTVIDWIA